MIGYRVIPIGIKQLRHEEDIGLHLVPRLGISGTLPPGIEREDFIFTTCNR